MAARLPRHLLTGILAALLAFAAGAARAQQLKAWAAPVDGAWTDPARWSPPGVPTALDFVEITAPGVYTVSLQGTGTAALLTLGGQGGNPVLAVQGSSARGNALLRVGGGLENNGTLRLESSGGAFAANLTIAGGALINRGAVEVYAGSGGQRLLSGDLRNLGRFSVDAPLQFSRSGGVYLNAGEFLVESGRTLSISGAGQVFRQQEGALKIRGDLNLASMAFDFAGGTLPEKAPLLLNSTLDIGPAATGAASFRLRGRCTLNGDVAPGQTLWVNGSAGVGATLSAASGFTNAGTLLLESSEASAAANLLLGTGALVNQGLLAIRRGAGGGRTLTGDLDNQGRLELETSATLTKSADGVYTNTGTVLLPAGDTLSISNGTLTSHTPARIEGGGTLVLTRVALHGSGTLGADLIASQCDLYPGNPIGILGVAGYCRLNALCSLNVEVAGTTPGTEYDRLAVGGPTTLGGALKVAMARAFRPLPCDEFAVLTHGGSTGRFTTTTGLDLGDGLNLLPTPLDSGLNLLARLSWQRISVNPTALSLAEGGPARSYRICLGQQPTATVRIASTADPQLAPAGQELFFAAAGWQEVKRVQVAAVDDADPEGAHSGVVTHLALSDDFNFQEYPVASVAASITDNDLLPGQLPTLDIDDPPALTGEQGELVFAVRLSRASATPVSVGFATEDASARAPRDYTPQSGTLTLAPGEVSKTIAVALVDDRTREPTENLFVRLTGPTNATLADDQAAGTITDDDPLPAVSASDARGTEGAGSLTFSLTLSNPSSEAVRIDYHTEDGTALAGHDYTATAGTLTFAPGQLLQSVSVPLRSDDLYEGDEDFRLVLSGPINGTLGDSRARGGILNDDQLPTFSIGAAEVDEGNGGAVPVSLGFEVRLSRASTQPVSVYYTTASGTAQAGRDFAAASGTLLFAPGETSKPLAVAIVGDQLSEPDETFSVLLGNATNAERGEGRALGTIRSDDGLPTLNLARDLAANEGNAGNSVLPFTVTLSSPSNQSVTVAYATIDNTAQAGSDYVAANGTLTFAPGQTSKAVNVIVRGDLAFEGDEYFALNLSNPANAVLGDGQALGTITNDDPTPSLAVNDTTLAEGNSGTRQLVFRVRLSNPSSLPVGVAYTTADSSALAGSDYTATSGRLQFNALETLKSLSVTVRGDTRYEGDEVLVLQLSDATNATLGRPRGRAVLLDDDAPPLLSLADTAAAEGDLSPGRLTFVLTLSAASALPVTVTYTTADSTAQAGSDYAAAQGSLTFAPGELRQVLALPLQPDRIYEPDETLLLTLRDPVNAALGRARAVGTLRNDDPLPSLSIADTSAAEGDHGDRPMTFALRLSNPSSQPISCSWTTADSTARAASDYGATAGTLTFTPGQLLQTLTVPVYGDSLYEPDETFAVRIADPVNATLGRARATGTLRNDDPLASLSLADADTLEGNQGTGSLVFAATLSAPLPQVVTVRYTTADNSAQAGSDYIAASGTLSFAPGQTRQTFAVAVRGDTLFEPDETFAVLLSDPANASLRQARATGTLRNDDHPPALSITAAAASEGDLGIKPLSFTATLSAPLPVPASIDFATADGSARADSDYLPTSSRLTFSPGETRKVFRIALVGDRTYEPDETLVVVLSAPLNLVPAALQVTGTLTNDDPLPAVSAADTAVLEGQQGLRSLPFTLNLTNPSSQPLTVAFTTQNGTALAGSDFLAASGRVVFSPGQTQKTIAVFVRGDRLGEPDETFALLLSNPSKGSLGRSRATGTIRNDDGGAKPLAAASADPILGAYPNPANPATTLAYTLSEDGPVRLVLWDVLGQEIRVLVEAWQAAGSYEVGWDGRNSLGRPVGTGMYYYRLEGGGRVSRGRLLLLR